MKATDLDGGYTTLMNRSETLPLGDIVGAGALCIVGERDPELCSHLINKALVDGPETELLPTGSLLEVSFFGKKVGEVETPGPSTLEGNKQPWLVLAHVAALRLAGDDDVSPNGRIISTVGAYPGLLRRFGDARWQKMEGFHLHEFPGKGSVPCLRHGVLEPLGQAIITGFFDRPDEMVSMTQHAVDDDRFHLAWRLNTAAREVTSATDAAAAEAAETAIALTDEYFERHYQPLLHGDTRGASGEQ